MNACCIRVLIAYNFRGPQRSINTARDSRAFDLYGEKVLSVFIDESGDDGDFSDLVSFLVGPVALDGAEVVVEQDQYCFFHCCNSLHEM